MFVGDLAREKGDFFRVLHTTKRTQVAVMTIAPGESAGEPETHEDADQVIHVVAGEALVRAGGREARAGPGTVLVVPAGVEHEVRSVGREPLFFLTVYGPPEY